MNNTDEWWAIDNVSLHQYGWSVTTFGGSRYDLPARRGENMSLAYRPGTWHRPKQADSRTIVLSMFLVGMDPATGNATGDERLRFNDSWDFLRRLVWKINGGRVTLTRRWELTAPVVPGLDDDEPGVPTPGPRIIVANATAEHVGQMAPAMTGRTRADFTFEFLLADPYFYGPDIEARVNPGFTRSLYNQGNDVAAFNHVEVDFVGPLTNPILTNYDVNPNVWVKYTGTIPTGQTVRLYNNTFQALQITAGNTNRIDRISHKGARHWMGVLPGKNQIHLDTSNSGDSGHALLRYRAPFV